MKLIIIRHGATKGNLEKRYVGSTDEDITGKAGQELLEMREKIVALIDAYFGIDGSNAEQAGFAKQDRIKIYVSPMKRAISTAEILFPDMPYIIDNNLRECDFGEYEYCNYEELKDKLEYQTFIDTMGESGFPGGETRRQFEERCCETFQSIIEEYFSQNNTCDKGILVIVAHGGTIMSIFDRYSNPHRDYYDWQVKNGEGYVTEIDRSGQLTNIKKLFYEKEA